MRINFLHILPTLLQILLNFTNLVLILIKNISNSRSILIISIANNLQDNNEKKLLSIHINLVYS